MSTQQQNGAEELDEQARFQLLQRYQEVQARLARACAAAGRPAEGVRLIAVSKRHSVAAIRALYGAGHRAFGENYVQELQDKWGQLRDLPALQLRLIGHLQRNKVRPVLEMGAVVDTVDSQRLGEAISSRAEQLGIQVTGLVQVNIGREPQKAGVMPEELPALMEALAPLPGLKVTGLMAIPPATAEVEARRPYFAELAQLAAAQGLAELSMGMSDDMDVAVAEGATMVRVGTAIFGERPG